MRKVFLLSILIICSLVAVSQTTKVKGIVVDSLSGEPVPLAAIMFEGTTVGITTDFKGEFSLETREKVKRISVSIMGYKPKLIEIKNGAYNDLKIELLCLDFNLQSVMISPGINPAHAILDSVVARRYTNDHSKWKGYKCRLYTKMELDLTNIGSRFKNRRMQKNFGFIFKYADTSSITGKSYLPVMIAESVSDFYHKSNPDFKREIINATKVSGLNRDETLAQFTGQLYVRVNAYDNYITMFQTKFAGPLSSHGRLFYKYFLVDSTKFNNRKVYKIRFHPKNLSVPVLDGEVGIDSTSYALVYADFKMPKGVNVNWLRHLSYNIKYAQVDSNRWFPHNDKFFADFSISLSDSSKITSFLGRRNVMYSNPIYGDDFPALVSEMTHSSILRKDNHIKNELYWDSIRPYKLSKKERNIYIMVDSIKQAPLFRTVYDIINMALFGYYNTKYIGIGPYHKAYSFNNLEGNKFRIGFRTTKDFSEKIRLNGHVSYSDKDRKIKGGGGIEYLFSELPTSKLKFYFSHDAVQLGTNAKLFKEGNILNSVFVRSKNDKLNVVDEIGLDWEREWTQFITQYTGIRLSRINSSATVAFNQYNGISIPYISSSEISIGAHISKDEVFVRNRFDKISIGSKSPIWDVVLTKGFKGIQRNDFNFLRLDLSFMYRLQIAPIGHSDIIIKGGRIWGQLPYPLLKLHEGNATYFYNKMAYSCMNYYEFASDSWISLFYEHNFRGSILGYFPLIKKLHLREVFTLKALVGNISNKNQSNPILKFPEGMRSVNRPYIEMGVGIENIFKIFRLDCIWRMTHRHNIVSDQKIKNFTINLSMRVNF